MSRKDFELIARTVRNLRVDSATREHVATELANDLADTNARFNRARFLAACGIGGAA